MKDLSEEERIALIEQLGLLEEYTTSQDRMDSKKAFEANKIKSKLESQQPEFNVFNMEGFNPKFLTKFSSQQLPQERVQLQFMFKNFLRYNLNNIL